MNFSDRRLGRRLALQYLFSLDYTGYDWQAGLASFWEMDPVRVSRESFEEGEEPLFEADTANVSKAKARAYAERLIDGACSNAAEISERIAAALDNWSPDRVGRVEWAVLRVAMSELLYGGGIPAAVVISEAVNLAKEFGAEDAPRFVNGVLDRMRKMLEEEDFFSPPLRTDELGTGDEEGGEE
jgi:transcription antitermination protein NusB